jgi:hypothetical protein
VLDDLAVRQREVREPAGVRRAVALEVVAHDHDPRPRRQDRDRRAQADAALQEAALAALVARVSHGGVTAA